MATAQLKNIWPGIQVRIGKRGKSIRYSCMVRGERYAKQCDLPVELALNDNGGPTLALKADFAKWQERCALSRGTARGLRIPSIRELITKYEEIAWKRNADPTYNNPSERTIETAIKNYHYCVEASGLKETRPYSDLMDINMIRKIFKRHIERGVKPVSAWSYISALQSVTAQWAIIEYRDAGLKVEAPIMPDFGNAKHPPQYRELSPQLIASIQDWYRDLEDHADAACVFYATCMLELAIRPVDIGRLTAANFPLSHNGHHRLMYTPKKTKESSNRRVDIEIPDALYEKLYSLRQEEWNSGKELLLNWKYIEVCVNQSLREACSMTRENYEKASYELRKLCIHTILLTPIDQGGGIDQAVRLSGDRRDTIEKYYCDPYKSHTALPYRPLDALMNQFPKK